MPSRNTNRNWNLASSYIAGNSGYGGLTTANLLFWGDESTFNSGSNLWENKLPYGLPDGELNGSGSASWERSGSVGFNMNGSNWIQFDRNQFLSSSYVGDGYTLSVTVSPSYQQITYGGGSIYQPMALWSPSATPYTSYPYMYINDACPGGPSTFATRTLFINYFGPQSPWARNTDVYTNTDAQNLNFTFVFKDVDGNYNIDWYLNGVFIRGGSFFNWGATTTFMQYFGRTSSTTTGDSSAADDRSSSCAGLTTNMPFTNFKGYIRDILIYNRPLAAVQVYQNYNALNRWSQINNS